MILNLYQKYSGYCACFKILSRPQLTHLYSEASETSQQGPTAQRNQSREPISDKKFLSFIKNLNPDSVVVQQCFSQLLRAVHSDVKGMRPSGSVSPHSNPFSVPSIGQQLFSVQPQPFALELTDVEVPSASRFPSPERRHRMAVNLPPPVFDPSRPWQFQSFSSEDRPEYSRNHSRGSDSANLAAQPQPTSPQQELVAPPALRQSPLSSASRSWLSQYTHSAPASEPRPVRPLPLRSVGSRRPLSFSRTTRDILNSAPPSTSPLVALGDRSSSLYPRAQSLVDGPRSTLTPSSSSQSFSEIRLQTLSDSLAAALRRRRTRDELGSDSTEERSANRQRRFDPSSEIQRIWQEENNPWDQAESSGRDTRRDGIIFDADVYLTQGADFLESSPEGAFGARDGDDWVTVVPSVAVPDEIPGDDAWFLPPAGLSGNGVPGVQERNHDSQETTPVLYSSSHLQLNEDE